MILPDTNNVAMMVMTILDLIITKVNCINIIDLVNHLSVTTYEVTCM